MEERILQIKNRLGLHARPAALFVQTSTKFKSRIRVFKNDQEVDGKSIMGLMTLAAECDSSIYIIIEGEDEKKAMEELSKLVQNGFNE
ncbi:MAG: hypothetical protein AUJ85_05260 [Elusimicrobia bacterium CG1_02_37_114]|nr:MAG: hypothetical protein AUJ85_05260 [Elusimicrobia bacterium CG1_02_37_114]PIV53039.1 MAG: HPr family phosphocarrier protein [Elusimicrobia bacterium CG02_land_8_20_14_3_00_37_13]PIZ13866.1 MAG: HPr family phosphocarrier protein [Elusimicrobia bacterium CG_4_10_14_0_8_um_filter_37_32]